MFLKKPQPQGCCPLVFFPRCGVRVFHRHEMADGDRGCPVCGTCNTVYFEGSVGSIVLQYLAFAAAALVISALMHWLARRISIP